MKNKKANSPVFVDRISELPEEIIHLILQSLDTHNEAGRTSILSRRWLNIWSTYPVVEFQDHNKDEHIEKLMSRYESFAAATSKRLLAVPELLLDTFNITMGRPFVYKDRHLYMDDQNLNKWLQQGELLRSSLGSRSPLNVVAKNYLSRFSGGHDPLDRFVRRLFMNCGRTKFLDLTGFDLSGLMHNVRTCLDNLQELCLEDVRVSEQSFPSCLANAPRLEKLSLKNIQGIRTLNISASNFPSLISLSYRENRYGDWMRLQLSSAPLLKTFRYEGHFVNLDVVAPAPSVKFVEFKLYDLGPPPEEDERRVDELIPKFPHLESLHLRAGNYNQKLRISAHTLRELTLADRSHKALAFEIDAPNLVTLTVDGATWPKTDKWDVVKVAPSCRCVFECSVLRGRREKLTTNKITTNWLSELKKCLAALATRFPHLVFKLKFPTTIEVKMLDLSRCSCLKVQYLLLGIDFPIANNMNKVDETRFFDAVLTAFHPKKLSVAQSSDNTSLFSYVTKQIERANLEKCGSNCKCWRHRFKDVEITNVTVGDISTIDKTMVSQSSVDIIFIVPRIEEKTYCRLFVKPT